MGLICAVLAGQFLLRGGGKALADWVRRRCYKAGFDLTAPVAALDYRVGDTTVTLPSGATLDTDGPLLDADLGADGTVCWLWQGLGYEAVLTVADPTGEPVYRWYSATRRLTACAMGEGRAAVAGWDDDGQLSVLLLDLDSEEPAETLELDRLTVYDLRFFGDTLLLVSDVAVLRYGDGQWSSFAYAWPQAFGFGDAFVAVLLEDSVLVCDADGNEQRFSVPDAQGLTVCGDYFAVTAGETVAVYAAAYGRISLDPWDGDPVSLRPDGSIS